MSSNNEELKVVVQRQMSGRQADTTFDNPDSDVAPKTSSEPTPPPAKHAQTKSLEEILHAAGKRAIGGGIPGAAAMGIQVCSLMWLRTTMNYQYRYGTSTSEAIKKLYAEGGVRRFYRGIGPAMFQGPLSRFGDTAANAGMLSLLNQTESTKDLSIAVKTAAASFSAGMFRICLMPIDTCKTILQVEGAGGVGVLRKKIHANGLRVMYHGSLGAAGATMVGHYPWFFTYNTLNEKIPVPEQYGMKLLRNALIGFTSSVVSDTTSNSIRVIKTTKQTHQEALTYPQAVRMVVKEDGIVGLFGRGLRTRILANGMQGMLFTVLWKFLEEQWNKNTN